MRDRPSATLKIATLIVISASVAACASATSTAGPSIGPGSSTGSSVHPSTAPATPAPTASPPTGAAPTAAPTTSPWSGGWHAAAPMLIGRVGFDAVRLGDGTVLAVGDDYACYPGGAQEGSELAERYDPRTDAWSPAPSLNKPRKSFATVTTADGHAMVMGGINPDDVAFSSTKRLAAGGDRWVDGPLMTVARGEPRAVTLPDGRIFVVSGTQDGSSSEIYDPAVDAWTSSTPTPAGRFVETMVPLADGQVLATAIIAEDEDSDPVMGTLLFDPADEDWIELAGPDAAGGAVLVPLSDGGALAIGGYSWLATDEDDLAGRRVDRFDPASGQWSSAAPLRTAREGAQMAQLPDGRVLVAGGAPLDWGADPSALDSTELYDPATDTWTVGPDLVEPRQHGTIVALDDGSVLLLGGDDDFDTEGETPWCPAPLASVERWAPGP